MTGTIDVVKNIVNAKGNVPLYINSAANNYTYDEGTETQKTVASAKATAKKLMGSGLVFCSFN